MGDGAKRFRLSLTTETTLGISEFEDNAQKKIR